MLLRSLPKHCDSARDCGETTQEYSVSVTGRSDAPLHSLMIDQQPLLLSSLETGNEGA